ncbi:MAG TPA: capsule biosynthesis protein [Caulobacteraceae bacterium]|jgi:capsular polysaccharide transport system permease protein|nr:capsule biosynthesis protein [Caulobacteraceae bacterium]
MTVPAALERSAPLVGARSLQTGAALGWLKARWPFFAVVVAPTLAAALFFFGIAANQYESDAHFVVKTATASYSPAGAGGLGQLLGLGASTAQTDSFSLADYLTSHDAVAAADRKLDLTGIFRRPEADPFSRLWYAHPKAETLLRYYRGHVHAAMNQDTGETVLTVRTFRPADSRALAETLLGLGEARVNEINARSLDDAIRVSRGELSAAEAELLAIQNQMTSFRTTERDIDPEKTSASELGLVGQLNLQIAQAKAQLSDMSKFLSPDSPQRIAMAARLRALQGQAGAEAGNLTVSGGGGMAPRLADYQSLQLRQDFAAKRYAAAAAALASAREQALRQQLFVERVVEPNLPQKATYPHRWVNVATVLVTLLLVYGIGWLVIAGFREHGA